MPDTIPGSASDVATTVQDAVVTTGLVTITGNATPAAGPLAVGGLDVCVMATVATGFTGSVVATPQLSYDGGTTWIAAEFIPLLGNAPTATTTATITTSSGAFIIRCTGATHVRVSSSAYSSGGTNPEVVLTASTGSATPITAAVMVLATGANVDAASNNPAGANNRVAVATGVAFTLSLNGVAATGAGSSIDTGVALSNPVCEVLASAVTTGGVVTFQGSMEGTNWYTIGTGTISANGTTVITASTTVAGTIIPARFLRANLTTRTDGTFTAWVGGSG